MGTLTTKQRKAMPRSEFGIPAKRAYPMPDASHAANAKARATQQAKKGNLSRSQANAVKAKANRVLARRASRTG